MVLSLIKKMFGSRNQRTLRRLEQRVAQINALETAMQALSDTELAAKTNELKQRYAEGASLDSLLEEAFATVREVSVRTLGMRHFDVQLIGGMVLHEGNIAEMRTGEGKTLCGTLPAYLNAITGKGVHIVTVNDYLAKRDSQWMLPIYSFLGLTVGVISPDMSHAEKQKAYQSDIVFGTNNEFGFDYLRDNMAFSLKDKVQRELHFAVVDEVDSILVDEARTPLIISGAAEGSSELYQQMNQLIPQLQLEKEEEDGGDYTVDEKQKQVHLTEAGHQHIEQMLADAGLLAAGQSLYHASNIILMHHVNAALRAHVIFQRDVDYIVKDKQVVIVDEHTGRTMPGRRWSDGLHQAVEAKENVPIQQENQTLASITFQNLFRMYDKLSGMTGTADTEAYEFQQIYNLEVVVIPTNNPMIRMDQPDSVYLSLEEKYHAVIEDIQECIARQQPVLVGTVSIEASEMLSQRLQKKGIPHQVLNAKFHEKEAQIIAEAGRPGAVTIATNMAGRGTDIVLGGNLQSELAVLPDTTTEHERQAIRAAWEQRHAQVIQAGGLRIIGSERHESRRIDNQLRGRAGRQGDPGSSRFYLSMDDNLLRIFASDKMVNMMRRVGMEPGEKLEHRFMTRTIESAQRKLEGYHFDVRKQLLEYDNVANNQREVVYSQRAVIMEIEDPCEIIDAMREEVVNNLVENNIPTHAMEAEWNVAGLMQTLTDDFQIKVDIKSWIEQDHALQPEQIKGKVLQCCIDAYRTKEGHVGRPVMAQFEKSLILQTLDSHWREHLAGMDHLRQGIHLRGYAQKDPRQEYKREAFELFTSMLDNMKYDIIRLLTAVQIQTEADIGAVEEQRRLDQSQHVQFLHQQKQEFSTYDSTGFGAEDDAKAETMARQQPFRKSSDEKTGRNDPCPCGSNRKFKHCHGKIA